MQQVTAGMFSSHEDKEQNAKCKSLNPALLTAPVNNMYDTCVLHVLMQRRQRFLNHLLHSGVSKWWPKMKMNLQQH